MKILVSFIVAFSFLISGCATSSKKESSFKLRPYKEVTLSNGLKVLLVKDSGLPYFTMMMLVRSGSTSDPANQKGLTSMVAGLLEKGTTKRSAIEIAESFGQIGSEFSATVDKDFTMIEASSLSFHQNQLIGDFAEVVTSPTFASREISRYRKQTLSELAKIVDDPSSFAALATDKYLYGDHPYADASIGRAEHVKDMSQEQIKSHYKKYFRPTNADLAVVGDFSDNIVASLEAHFGSWGPQEVPATAFPDVPNVSGVNIQLVDKNDLAQAQIRFGHKGIRRDNPDYLTLRVANAILGGGFASRLMQEIRVKRGLTYGINSRFSAMKDDGPFLVSTFTRLDKTGEMITETLNVLEKYKKDGVTQKEVDDAKALIKGQFPKALETAERTAQNLLQLRYYDVPDSYLQNFLADIDKISRRDVNEAIRKYINPQNIKVMVFAPRAKVEEQLKPLGKLKAIDYKDLM